MECVEREFGGEGRCSSTGADIAASMGSTGASSLGGDWLLEVQTGPISTVPLVSGFDGLLALDTVGEVAFIGFNADVNDAFSLVALDDIDPNTVVYFSENEWDGSVFNTGEGRRAWDSGGATIVAGTVVTFSGTGTLTINAGDTGDDVINITSLAASYAAGVMIDDALNLVINEVDSDTPGTDAVEFIELYDGGASNTDLTGVVVVLFNGSGDQSYAAFDLDGQSTDAGGYFVLGSSGTANVDWIFANGLLQNGADAVALFVGDETDFPNGTAVTTVGLLDAIVYDTSDADDAGLLVLLNASEAQVNENVPSGTRDIHSMQRVSNGQGGRRNTSSYQVFAPTRPSAVARPQWAATIPTSPARRP